MLPWFQNASPYPSAVGHLCKYYLASPWVQLLSRGVVVLRLIHVHCFFIAWCIAELMSTVSLCSSWMMAVFFRAAIWNAATRNIWAHELLWNTCSFNLNKYLQQMKIEISMRSPSWMLDCFPDYFATVSRSCKGCQHHLLSHFSNVLYWCSVAGHLFTGCLSILFCEMLLRCLAHEPLLRVSFQLNCEYSVF